MDPECGLDVPASLPIRLSEEIREVDGFLVSTRVPCEDPSKIPRLFHYLVPLIC